MYESPTELIRDIVPIPVVSFTTVARAAGVFYLLSVVLPPLSDRLAFAEYTSLMYQQPKALNAPFSADLTAIAVSGTAVGPIASFGSAPSLVEGILYGLVDLVATPALVVALPLTGIVLTIAPLVFAAILLSGYDKHITLMALSYMMLIFVYGGMMAIKSASLSPRLGLTLMGVATGLTVFLASDRTHQIGLVAGNGYPLPPQATRSSGASETTADTPDEDEPVSFAGSARRSDSDRS